MRSLALCWRRRALSFGPSPSFSRAVRFGVVAVLAQVLLAACAYDSSRGRGDSDQRYRRNPEPELTRTAPRELDQRRPSELSRDRRFPKAITVRMTISEYLVTDIRPVTTLGRIDSLFFNDLYKSRGGVTVRFEPESSEYCGCFYVARIPERRNGVERAVFRRVDETVPEGTPPPSTIPLRVLIKDRRVAGNFQVRAVDERFVGLYARGYYDVEEEGIRVVQIASTNFPGEFWEMVLPEADGVYNVTALRVEYDE